MRYHSRKHVEEENESTKVSLPLTHLEYSQSNDMDKSIVLGPAAMTQYQAFKSAVMAFNPSYHMPVESESLSAKDLTDNECEFSNIVSITFGHNRGVLTSEDRGIAIVIPEGTIEDGHSEIFCIALGLFGPIVLPAQSNTQPVIDQQHSLPLYPAQVSADTVQCHSLIGVNVQSTNAQPSLKIIPPRLAEASPLPDSNIVSSSCDHNGGILTSKHGDLKVTIPEGAIKDGDLATFYIATDLFGPFVLPSKCQADVVSPYYWIGANGSYHFHKPIKVEFEHFGACDPSHYQLLCCEDDDESYTMRPVDYELSFTVRDDMSWCTFRTNHFCSYCLFHGCEDPKINRISAVFLNSNNFQFLNQSQVWFRFPISYCLKRNEELYTKEGMILDGGQSYNFEAPSDKTSVSYFTLTYSKEIDLLYLSISFYNFPQFIGERQRERYLTQYFNLFSCRYIGLK